jgi:hypothetical protein
MNLFFDELENKITIPDEHYYQSSVTKNWLPSATRILSVYQKGYGYELWLKQTGVNASEILKQAGETGSKVHALIDEYAKLPDNVKLSYLTEDGKEKYDWEVWELFCKAMEFFTKFKPEILVHEFSFANDKLGYGGTIDMVCKINNQIWLIDYKSGNYIHDSHYLQISAYARAWNELNPNYEIERAGLLHLKASTLKEIDGKMQGKGWKLEESENMINDFDYFQYCQKIFNRVNPNAKPKIQEFPLSFTKNQNNNTNS